MMDLQGGSTEAGALKHRIAELQQYILTRGVQVGECAAHLSSLDVTVRGLEQQLLNIKANLKDNAETLVKAGERKGKGPPPRCYVSPEESGSLSSYMRGPLTLENVNTPVDEMAIFAESNARFLTIQRSNLGEDMLQKVLGAYWMAEIGASSDQNDEEVVGTDCTERFPDEIVGNIIHPTLLRDTYRSTLSGERGMAEDVNLEYSELFPPEHESEVGLNELLPGIPNDIVLMLICTKVPWQALSTLWWVSRRWQEAIESGIVRDERVRCQAATTLLIHSHPATSHPYSRMEDLFIYSGDSPCLPLPKIISGDQGVTGSQCTALGSRIFVIGGADPAPDGRTLNEVYMLDLHDEIWMWHQVASMKKPRCDFICGVMDGRIYVLGGWDNDHSVNEFETYDPVEDSWFLMPTMDSSDMYKVTPVGNAILLAGDLELLDYPVLESFPEVTYGASRSYRSSYLGLYHPGKDEWGLAVSYPSHSSEVTFVASGKLYLFTREAVFMIDTEYKARLLLHVNSFPTHIISDGSKELLAASVTVVGDVIYTSVYAYDSTQGGYRISLMRGDGFGSDVRQLLWKQQNCTQFLSLKCAIQL